MPDDPDMPTQVDVPIEAETPILALGAELKSAPCLLVGRRATLAGPVGDVREPEGYREFLAAVEALRECCGARPVRVACDMHPDYAATRYARTLSQPVIEVQHHHAHIAAGMAENGLTGRAVGLACDGTGYGTDGTIWGGEVLLCDASDGSFERVGHLRCFSLPGGDAAAIETWRPAVGMLFETFGADWPEELSGLFSGVDPQTLELTRARLASPSSRPVRTSSLGRLFDGAAFLLGLCDRNDVEAQAPRVLQAAAEACKEVEPLSWSLEESPDGVIEMDIRPLVRDLLAGRSRARPVNELARAFHSAVATMLAVAAEKVCERMGENRVVLSGGCFANRLLADWVDQALQAAGREVYTHHRISPGDAAVALGQAVVAAGQFKKGS